VFLASLARPGELLATPSLKSQWEGKWTTAGRASVRPPAIDDVFAVSFPDMEQTRKEKDVEGEGRELVQTGVLLRSARSCRWVVDYGKVEVGRRIGAGSTGAVFEGTYAGARVVIKRLAKQKFGEEAMLEFFKDMGVLASLQHAALDAPIGIALEPLAIVYRFHDEGTLDRRFGTGRLDNSTRRQVALDLADGLTHLHARKIRHGNIKPSNVLVEPDGTSKLVDIGFSRIREENRTMTNSGSPIWQSPEEMRGKEATLKSDVYAFGLLMWSIGAMQMPFADINFMEVVMKILDGERPGEKDCAAMGENYVRVMRSCWDDDPKNRPSARKILKILSAETKKV